MLLVLKKLRIFKFGNRIRIFAAKKNIRIFVSIPNFNPLPNDKFLDLTKLKAFADNNLNVANMMNFLYDRAENTVEKGENAGYQHFLLLLQCFPKPSSLGWLKVGTVWQRVKQHS